MPPVAVVVLLAVTAVVLFLVNAFIVFLCFFFLDFIFVWKGAVECCFLYSALLRLRCSRFCSTVSVSCFLKD